MNTNTKFALKITGLFVIALSIILIFTVYSLVATKNEEVAKFRLEKIQQIKDTLKNRVNTAYAMLNVNYQNSTDKAFLEKFYGSRLKNIIDVADTILNTKLEAFKREELTFAEAQAQAKAEIAMLRYDNGNGYVWINDTTLPYPKMLMHPLSPALDGQLLTNKEYNRAMGKGLNIYAEAVNISQAHGKGFVDFLWDKPTENGVVENMPKLAYVKLFHEWTWVLGTAAYVDGAQLDAKEKSQDDIRQMNKPDNSSEHLWVSTAASNPKLIVHPKMPLQEGKILEGKQKSLYRSFIDVCKTHSGSGFKMYNWPKTMTSNSHLANKDKVAKLAYVKLHSQLNWIVGTDIYMDGVDKAVATENLFLEHQIQSLILKVMAIAIGIILLVSILSYIVSPYISREKMPSAKSSQPPPLPLGANLQFSSPVTTLNNLNSQPQEIPPLANTNNEQATWRSEDCVRMIQEISRTLIAEQAKILAAAMGQVSTGQVATPQPSFQTEDSSKEQKITDEIKNLASKTYQTIDEVKKMVEANQPPQNVSSVAIDEVKRMLEANQPPQVQDKVDATKFNNVMGNLNEMVNDVAKGLKT